MATTETRRYRGYDIVPMNPELVPLMASNRLYALVVE
jgi:hypothetical protein